MLRPALLSARGWLQLWLNYYRGVSGRIVGEAEIRRLERVFARHGAAAVVITRALPVVMETMSVVAGLSAMRRSTFLLASVAGTAPIVVVYAYAGAVSREMGSLIPAVVMLIAVAGGAFIWYRASMAERPAPRIDPVAADAGEVEPQP